MRSTEVLKSGNISEQSIHKALMDWVRYHPYLKKIVLHFPNEGKRTPRFGKLLKELGMRAGVPDLFIPHANHGYHGAWIELKSKNGKLSAFQKEFMLDMTNEGYFTAVCWSLDDAIKMISWYCLD